MSHKQPKESLVTEWPKSINFWVWTQIYPLFISFCRTSRLATIPQRSASPNQKAEHFFFHIKRGKKTQKTKLTANSGRFFSRFSSPPSKIVARDVRRTLENTSSCWHAVETLVISPWYPASDISYKNKNITEILCYLHLYFSYPNKSRKTQNLCFTSAYTDWNSHCTLQKRKPIKM